MGTITLREGMGQHSRIFDLVRRALSVLEEDCGEAGRCLKDACTLMDTDNATKGTEAPRGSALRTGGLAAWQVRRAVDYVEARLGTGIATEDVAGVLGLSKSHFSRAFKISVGSSPMAFVAGRRVERARLMIVSSRESLAEVALTCGFADQSHLNRQFRRVLGMTPGQWRRTSLRAPGAQEAPRDGYRA